MNLRDQKLYTEDWLGLRSLDERGALVFQTIDSAHVKATVGTTWIITLRCKFPRNVFEIK